MLKTRILTALVIALVTLGVLFLAPPWGFRVAIAALLLTGTWEFRRLAALPPATGWLLLALQALLIGLMALYWQAAKAEAIVLLAAGAFSWLLMYSRLLVFRAGDRPTERYRRLGFSSALVAVTICWFALGWLRDQPHGPFVIFLLLVIIWASDVGAYFSGRLLGRRKLAPAISPGKTWEGVAGGVVLAIAAAFLLQASLPGLGMSPWALVALSAATTLTSVGGDLFISVLKRTVGLKDTGSLFPGHGGVLDRYDSLLAGAPFFALIFAMVRA